MPYILVPEEVVETPEKPGLFGGFIGGVIYRLLSRLFPAANPDFEDRYLEVSYWYLEIQDGRPVREIGFTGEGKPVVLGPYGDNRGFSTDSPVTLDPTDYQPIPEQEFLSAWSELTKKLDEAT